MPNPKILIVGCGAVGLTQGYILSAGANITYLVRPGRAPAFTAPKKLYQYKTNTLHTFENYRVVESVSELADEVFYCVFDTLDGHTARSEGGIATLRSVGDLIRSHAETFVIYDAIGIDIEQHYAETMGISQDRFVFAASMLAHQPTPSIPVPNTSDKDLVSQADMLYSPLSTNTGITVMNKRPALTKMVEDVYIKNGVVTMQKIPALLESLMPLSIVQLVVWKIEGWHELSSFRTNTELWNLVLRAQSETLTLPRFGWKGWVFSWILGSWTTAKMLGAVAEACLPLQVHVFNEYHHGWKVIQQDILLLEQLVSEGEKAKKKMPALREVIRRASELPGGK
ncbi:ketopantoate reductase ApbA/PanE domain-containing protein [Massarina eburnea CBS 473.64]|uniref:Ketopantoate reductase ApbA/PanE domain-containing protein n=1 Tax=Massarina eburnea CBS 473.64 TaxID=1395130 RepID=A0A6A6S4Q4_9PLEO|nr:ketopantoate reductase ApbA/PanE domain-containing protein [Massarina eburnea CBS 473.64]